MPQPKPMVALNFQKVRVRLAEATPKVALRGFDLRFFEGEGTYVSRTGDRRLAAAVDRSSEWEVRCHDGRVRAVASGGVDGGRTLDLREPVSIETPAGFLSFQGRPYREMLKVYSVGSFCEVVNEVDIEKYLDGLVNAEFSSNWSEEAVAAQVVAARTYALYQLQQARKDRDSHFDVDATVRDQVYDGSVREDYRASRSVERTRGLVLVPAVLRGAPGVIEPIKAFYHSTCGGHTELPEHVWGNKYAGFKRAVVCPYCASSPRFHWQAGFTAAEIAKALLKGARSDGALPTWPANWRQVLKSGNLTGFRVASNNEAGRAAELITVWSGAKSPVELRVSGARFRDWAGPGVVRSTAFGISKLPAASGTQWVLQGQGHGHGVGMCQWGAKTMGARGYRMAKILQHYYPDAKLARAW